MSKVCHFTWKRTGFWNNRSHSMVATRRKFRANIFKKKLDLWDWVKVSVNISSRQYKKLRWMLAI